ncbi:MAG: argininosuccinate synthase [Candidatus Levybacteria bacterium]|nr:argininosuccinate synthase [Candidatus Levybacteria bacterium]MBI2421103.1 argininosuccinate synthase [Candidatus Levybacteria bacterium]
MQDTNIENLELSLNESPKVDSYTAKRGEFDKCLLLFSGGLDTSCMAKWIKEKYACEVYTFTLNVGQIADFDEIEKKAYKLGAKKHFSVDGRKELIEDFCWKAVKANAIVGRNGHPISSSLTRPLIIKKAVEIAKSERIPVIAHGASGKANDSLRFDTSALTLYPAVKIIAPVREWSMSREAELEYAKMHNIEVGATSEKPYSIDDNMWGRETEAGILNHPDKIAPEDVYSLTTLPETAPDKATFIAVEFVKGIAVKVNGKKLSAVRLVETLNKIGSKNGIGMFDFMEDRGVGIKVREIHESPAAEILIKAHTDLEELTLTKEELRLKRIVELEWVSEALNGFWFTPLMQAMNVFIDELNKRATGTITLRLYKGKATIISRESLYALDMVNLMHDDFIKEVNQKATPPFIEVSGLQRRASQWMTQKAENGKRK